MLDITSQVFQARVDVVVVNINVDVDSSNFKVLQAYLEKQVEEGAQYLLLNFQNVKHISSAGLRVIHNLFNTLRSLHKDVNDDELRKHMSTGNYKSPYLKVCNLAPHVADIFNLGGFDIYIESAVNQEVALSSF